MIGMTLLTYRIQADAVPVLKQCVDDPEMSVRSRVAHLLAMYGDSSGLERMRKDLVDYTRTDIYSNNMENKKLSEQDTWFENRRLAMALEAAKTLAEFGDCSGYELAVNCATKDIRYLRDEAAGILVKLGKLEEKQLIAEGCDPITVLCFMAESEEDDGCLMLFVNEISKLNPKDTINILRKLDRSGKGSEKIRSLIKGAILYTENRLKREEGVRATH
jgi:hypothetical protein